MSSQQKGKQRASRGNPRYVASLAFDDYIHTAYPYERALNALQSALNVEEFTAAVPIDAFHLLRIALLTLKGFVRPLLYTDIPDDARHHACVQAYLIAQVHEYSRLPDILVGGEDRIEAAVRGFKPANIHERLVHTFACDFMRSGRAYFRLLAEGVERPKTEPLDDGGWLLALKKAANAYGPKNEEPSVPKKPPSAGKALELKLALEVFRTGADAALEVFRHGIFVHFDDARAMWAREVQVEELKMLIFIEIKRQILLPAMAEASNLVEFDPEEANPEEGSPEEGSPEESYHEEVSQEEAIPEQQGTMVDAGVAARVEEDSSSDSWENVWFGEEEGLIDPSAAAEGSLKDAEEPAAKKKGKKGKKIRNAKLLKARARRNK